MLAVSITWFIPIFILLALVLLFGTVLVLGRVKNGRYLRPVIEVLAKIPGMRGLLQKASRKAIERSNPELASAMKKVERYGGTGRDPMKAQQAMSRLTAQERRALLDMQEQQGIEPEGLSREQRRRLERAKKRRR